MKTLVFLLCLFSITVNAQNKVAFIDVEKEIEQTLEHHNIYAFQKAIQDSLDKSITVLRNILQDKYYTAQRKCYSTPETMEKAAEKLKALVHDAENFLTIREDSLAVQLQVLKDGLSPILIQLAQRKASIESFYLLVEKSSLLYLDKAVIELTIQSEVKTNSRIRGKIYDYKTELLRYNSALRQFTKSVY